MDTRELLQKIKRIEIKALGVSQQLFAGSYKSAFKGSGMEFSEVRQYTPGDETRTIDWNVTARYNEPFVKTFEEEKDQVIQLLVDVSRSSFIASEEQSKREYMAELVAVIALSAVQSNEKVGLMLFSEEVELRIPPAKGRKHALRLIRAILSHRTLGKGTSISAALNCLQRVEKKKVSCFLISDYLDEGFQKTLKTVARRHALVGIQIHSAWDKQLFDLGWVSLLDVESGKEQLVNSSSEEFKSALRKAAFDKENDFKDLLRKSGAKSMSLNVGGEYLKPFMQLFGR